MSGPSLWKLKMNKMSKRIDGTFTPRLAQLQSPISRESECIQHARWWWWWSKCPNKGAMLCMPVTWLLTNEIIGVVRSRLSPLQELYVHNLHNGGIGGQHVLYSVYTERERVLPAPYATYPSFRPSILVFVLISISPQ